MKTHSLMCSILLLLCLASAPPAFAQWVDIKDPSELRALYSNKTFKGKGPEGEPIVAHYRADGKGILIWRGERIPRTWEIKGNDQVCVTDRTGTNCFQIMRHEQNRNEIVGRHVTRYWIFQVTVEDGIPNF